GCGLSRGNLITPAAIVALLRYMDRHPSRNDFRNSLPVAGVDGTLKDRMVGTPAEGNARAKTGSLRGIHTLAGYVTSAAGEPFAFSLMLNNYHPDTIGETNRSGLDEIVVLLAMLQSKTAHK
ncbi:MAG: D-alanyl-D-alanine carboxypeptidase, partial [Verrucomicrobiae bacterium]|nr:D-alanyl-D-alanine carboxypeptidase [Verrucomicrobiae bacterium]